MKNLVFELALKGRSFKPAVNATKSIPAFQFAEKE